MVTFILLLLILFYYPYSPHQIFLNGSGQKQTTHHLLCGVLVSPLWLRAENCSNARVALLLWVSLELMMGLRES